MADVRDVIDDESVAESPEAQAEESPGSDEPESQGRKGDKGQRPKTRRWSHARKAVSADRNEAAPPRRWIRVATRWAAGVVFVAVVAVASFEGWLLFQQHQKDAAAAHALDAAQKYAVTLTSADPNTIDQKVADIINGATGDFKNRYTKASSELRKLLIDNKVTTQGAVVDSAVKSATANQVKVLLFVKQSVSNSASPTPGTDLTAVTITMEKVDGRWMASEVVLPGESR